MQSQSKQSAASSDEKKIDTPWRVITSVPSQINTTLHSELTLDEINELFNLPLENVRIFRTIKKNQHVKEKNLKSDEKKAALEQYISKKWKSEDQGFAADANIQKIINQTKFKKIETKQEAGQTEFEKGLDFYLRGRYIEAKATWKLSIRKNYPPAFLFLGLIHEGRGGFLDLPAKADQYYQSARDYEAWFLAITPHSSPRKLFYSGLYRLLAAKGNKQNDLTAFALIREAAIRNDALAQRQMGLFYLEAYYMGYENEGFPANYIAYDWFVLAAEQDNASAACHAGMLLVRDSAGECFDKPSEVTGLGGELFSTGKKQGYFFAKAADLGHVKAQFLVGKGNMLHCVNDNRRARWLTDYLEGYKKYSQSMQVFNLKVAEQKFYKCTNKGKTKGAGIIVEGVTVTNVDLDDDFFAFRDKANSWKRILQEGYLKAFQEEALNYLATLCRYTFNSFESNLSCPVQDELRINLRRNIETGVAHNHGESEFLMALYLVIVDQADHEKAFDMLNKAVQHNYANAKLLQQIFALKAYPNLNTSIRAANPIDTMPATLREDLKAEFVIGVDGWKKILQTGAEAKNSPEVKDNIIMTNLLSSMRSLIVVAEGAKFPPAYLYLFLELYLASERTAYSDYLDFSHSQIRFASEYFFQKIVENLGWFQLFCIQNPNQADVYCDLLYMIYEKKFMSYQDYGPALRMIWLEVAAIGSKKAKAELEKNPFLKIAAFKQRIAEQKVSRPFSSHKTTRDSSIAVYQQDQKSMTKSELLSFSASVSKPKSEDSQIETKETKETKSVSISTSHNRTVPVSSHASTTSTSIATSSSSLFNGNGVSKAQSETSSKKSKKAAAKEAKSIAPTALKNASAGVTQVTAPMPANKEPKPKETKANEVQATLFSKKPETGGSQPGAQPSKEKPKKKRK